MTEREGEREGVKNMEDSEELVVMDMVIMMVIETVVTAG